MLTLFILDLALDIVDGVRRLHLQSDGLASKCLYDYEGVSNAGTESYQEGAYRFACLHGDEGLNAK